MDRQLAAKIGRLLWRGRFSATPHAHEEMWEDGISVLDLINVAGNMERLETLTDDPRGPRYRFEGLSWGRRIGVVARMTPFGRLRIITTYEVEEA